MSKNKKAEELKKAAYYDPDTCAYIDEEGCRYPDCDNCQNAEAMGQDEEEDW